MVVVYLKDPEFKSLDLTVFDNLHVDNLTIIHGGQKIKFLSPLQITGKLAIAGNVTIRSQKGGAIELAANLTADSLVIDKVHQVRVKPTSSLTINKLEFMRSKYFYNRGTINCQQICTFDLKYFYSGGVFNTADIIINAKDSIGLSGDNNFSGNSIFSCRWSNFRGRYTRFNNLTLNGKGLYNRATIEVEQLHVNVGEVKNFGNLNCTQAATITASNLENYNTINANSLKLNIAKHSHLPGTTTVAATCKLTTGQLQLDGELSAKDLSITILQEDFAAIGTIAAEYIDLYSLHDINLTKDSSWHVAKKLGIAGKNIELQEFCQIIPTTPEVFASISASEKLNISNTLVVKSLAATAKDLDITNAANIISTTISMPIFDDSYLKIPLTTTANLAKKYVGACQLQADNINIDGNLTNKNGVFIIDAKQRISFNAPGNNDTGKSYLRANDINFSATAFGQNLTMRAVNSITVPNQSSITTNTTDFHAKTINVNGKLHSSCQLLLEKVVTGNHIVIPKHATWNHPCLIAKSIEIYGKLENSQPILLQADDIIIHNSGQITGEQLKVTGNTFKQHGLINVPDIEYNLHNYYLETGDTIAATRTINSPAIYSINADNDIGNGNGNNNRSNGGNNLLLLTYNYYDKTITLPDHLRQSFIPLLRNFWQNLDNLDYILTLPAQLQAVLEQQPCFVDPDATTVSINDNSQSAVTTQNILNSHLASGATKLSATGNINLQPCSNLQTDNLQFNAKHAYQNYGSKVNIKYGNIEANSITNSGNWAQTGGNFTSKSHTTSNASKFNLQQTNYYNDNASLAGNTAFDHCQVYSLNANSYDNTDFNHCQNYIHNINSHGNTTFANNHYQGFAINQLGGNLTFNNNHNVNAYNFNIDDGNTALQNGNFTIEFDINNSAKNLTIADANISAFSFNNPKNTGSYNNTKNAGNHNTKITNSMLKTNNINLSQAHTNITNSAIDAENYIYTADAANLNTKQSAVTSSYFANHGSAEVSHSALTITDFANSGNAKLNNADLTTSYFSNYGDAEVKQSALVANNFSNFGAAKVNQSVVTTDCLVNYGNAKVKQSALVANDFCIYGTAKVNQSALTISNLYAHGGKTDIASSKLAGKKVDVNYNAGLNFLDSCAIKTKATTIKYGKLKLKSSLLDCHQVDNNSTFAAHNAKINASTFNNHGKLNAANAELNANQVKHTGSINIANNNFLTINTKHKYHSSTLSNIKAEHGNLNITCKNLNNPIDFYGNNHLKTLNLAGNINHAGNLATGNHRGTSVSSQVSIDHNKELVFNHDQQLKHSLQLKAKKLEFNGNFQSDGTLWLESATGVSLNDGREISGQSVGIKASTGKIINNGGKINSHAGSTYLEALLGIESCPIPKRFGYHIPEIIATSGIALKSDHEVNLTANKIKAGAGKFSVRANSFSTPTFKYRDNETYSAKGFCKVSNISTTSEHALTASIEADNGLDIVTNGDITFAGTSLTSGANASNIIYSKNGNITTKSVKVSDIIAHKTKKWFSTQRKRHVVAGEITTRCNFNGSNTYLHGYDVDLTGTDFYNNDGTLTVKAQNNFRVKRDILTNSTDTNDSGLYFSPVKLSAGYKNKKAHTYQQRLGTGSLEAENLIVKAKREIIENGADVVTDNAYIKAEVIDEIGATLTGGSTSETWNVGLGFTDLAPEVGVGSGYTNRTHHVKSNFIARQHAHIEADELNLTDANFITNNISGNITQTNIKINLDTVNGKQNNVGLGGGIHFDHAKQGSGKFLSGKSELSVAGDCSQLTMGTASLDSGTISNNLRQKVKITRETNTKTYDHCHNFGISVVPHKIPVTVRVGDGKGHTISVGNQNGVQIGDYGFHVGTDGTMNLSYKDFGISMGSKHLGANYGVSGIGIAKDGSTAELHFKNAKFQWNLPATQSVRVTTAPKTTGIAKLYEIAKITKVSGGANANYTNSAASSISRATNAKLQSNTTITDITASLGQIESNRLAYEQQLYDSVNNNHVFDQHELIAMPPEYLKFDKDNIKSGLLYEYFDKQTLAQHKFSIDNADGKFRIGGKIAEGSYTYVIGKQGEIYGSPVILFEGQKRRLVNHSHFFEGDNPNRDPVLQCAGVIVLQDGKLMSINSGSGHYKPNAEQLDRASVGLHLRDIVQDNTVITTVFGDIFSSRSYKFSDIKQSKNYVQHRLFYLEQQQKQREAMVFGL